MNETNSYFIATADILWVHNKLTDHNGCKKTKVTTKSIVLDTTNTTNNLIVKVTESGNQTTPIYTFDAVAIMTKAKTEFNKILNKPEMGTDANADVYVARYINITQLRKTNIPALEPSIHVS